MKKKLHYLLVMPKLATNTNVKYNFPLGIAYVSSALKQAGFNVQTINPNHTDNSLYTILKDKLDNIDVLLTGGLAGQFHLIKEVLDCAKKIKPNIRIIVGGGLITSNPIIAMNALENADIGVRGEGEITCVELCHALENNKDLSEIQGLVLKKDTSFYCTEERKEIVNIDNLPFPDYEGFDIQSYLKLTSQSMFGADSGSSFFALSARSCPYNCTFCFHTVGKKYRVRSLENVIAEIDILRNKYNITQMILSDELFASSKERVKLFSDYMKSVNMSWVATFRIDQIDDELIEIIKNSTCKQMFFGIESVNNTILKSMKKNITFEMIEKNLQKVYNANIPFGGNLLFGDIQDTFETCMDNINWFLNHPEYNLSLINISCYPGTEIYHYAVKNGIIKDEIQFLKENCPVINITKMSNEEFSLIQEKILEYGNGVPLNNQNIISHDNNTKLTKISGICKKCQHTISSENILLFTTDYSYIFCPHCGAKYRVVLPLEIEKSIINNIEKLSKNHKIAIWGVHPSTWNFFNKYSIFENDSITFIDSSTGKQLIKITNKKKTIFPPSILNDNHFDYVIFCYPHLYSTYAKVIKNSYKTVQNFLDIISLISLK